jgi:hypothetical protein
LNLLSKKADGKNHPLFFGLPGKARSRKSPLTLALSPHGGDGIGEKHPEEILLAVIAGSRTQGSFDKSFWEVLEEHFFQKGFLQGFSFMNNPG